MNKTQRTRSYFSSPSLAQHPRVELLPSPSFDWHAARHWFVPMLVLAAMVVLYLLQSSFATTSELEIARLTKERDAITHRNIQLAAEIADLEKPTRIRERAHALGLVDTSKSIKLNVPVGVPELDMDLPSATFVDTPSPWQQFLNEFARWLSQSTKTPH